MFAIGVIVRQLFVHLERFPWWMSIVLVILLFTIIALMAIFAMRRNVDSDNLKGHHDVSGFVFANLGVLYSVLLGFTVVNVQARFDKIAENSRIEAASIAELYREAQVFPNAADLQTALKAYIKSILEEEWEVLYSGKAHPKTEKLLNDVWNAYYKVDISTPREQILYAESIRKLGDSVSARLSRLLGGEESLGDEMWTMLLLGGILIVAFMCMFTFEALWLHLLLAFLLAASIAFPLFLIYTLDTAFSGSIRIEPEAFRDVLSSFK